MERVVNYLSQFQIPIRVVSFDVFQGPDGSRLLVREVLDDEASPTPDRKDKKSRTIEEIGKVAESEGVGEAYQQIIAAATGSGLFCRPYKHSVMITPPSHKSRFLMLLNPRPGQGLRTFHGANAFAEFIPDPLVQSWVCAHKPEEGLHVQLVRCEDLGPSGVVRLRESPAAAYKVGGDRATIIQIRLASRRSTAAVSRHITTWSMNLWADERMGKVSTSELPVVRVVASRLGEWYEI